MPVMNSVAFNAQMFHERLSPTRHAFRYPVSYFSIDLDDLTKLSQKLAGLFAVNGFAPFSIREKDYLFRDDRPLRTKVLDALARSGIDTSQVERIQLITSPRFFGYAFNPVSFYYCLRADGSSLAYIAEVNNTFSERHLYVLNPLDLGTGLKVQKEFHVSPFYDRKGEYRFKFGDLKNGLDIHINLFKDNKMEFISYVRGTATPLSRRFLIRSLITRPIRLWLTFPRILWQAGILHYIKKLPVFQKPQVESPWTIRVRPPTTLERMGQRLIFSFFKKFRTHRISLTLPEGQEFLFGDSKESPSAHLKIKDYSFFKKVMLRGDIGLGESFVDGDWETPSLVQVLKFFAANMESVNHRGLATTWVERLRARIQHALRSNTLSGSRKNIEAHYDLSNEFFSTFLDESMTYSCALFDRPDESLESAQLRKIDRILDRARVKRGHHILEIGSGWGALAMRAAARGCRVTSLTLSKQQHEYVTQRIKAASLEGQIEIRLEDYRVTRGSFDRIVSVEMLEAVGHEHFGSFFAACDRLLKPEGIVSLQVITIPDQRYDAYRKSTDWIQHYIFPGGLCPSLNILSETMTKHSQLLIEDLQNIGPHYATTLRRWAARVRQNEAKIRSLGFDEKFLRTWYYYLAYCEAGFELRLLNTLQLVLTRANNLSLDERTL